MMITNYQEFLVEKIIYQSLNESVFYFTKEFLKILKEIDSPISKFLIDKYSEDIPVSSNYLDVDGKETISFISDAKAQRLLQDPEKSKVYQLKDKERIINILNLGDIDYKDMLTKYGDTSDIVANKFILDSESIPENQEFEKVGDIRFYNVPLVILKFDDKFILTWETNVKETPSPFFKNRQTIRVGRGIRAILNSLKQTFTDAEIEDFVNKWKAAYDHLQNEFRDFQIVKGDDIGYWYNYRNYELETSKGTLGSSCMAMKPAHFFEIYTKNSDVCSLVILKSSKDKIRGRALLWKLDDGKMFMDRVYTHFDSDFALFVKFAKHNGWLRKASQNSASDEALVLPDGKSVDLSLYVTIRNENYQNYPYMDTLKYLTEYTDSCTLSNDRSDAKWQLESTSGGRDTAECETCNGDGEIECSNCERSGEVINECDECDGTGEVRCEDCVQGKIECGECSGTGSIEDDEGNDKECEECAGIGDIECDNNCYKGWITCDNCDGSGNVTERCEECRGGGYVNCPDC